VNILQRRKRGVMKVKRCTNYFEVERKEGRIPNEETKL
jgi:hypothetical protein